MLNPVLIGAQQSITAHIPQLYTYLLASVCHPGSGRDQRHSQVALVAQRWRIAMLFVRTQLRLAINALCTEQSVWQSTAELLCLASIAIGALYTEQSGCCAGVPRDARVCGR